MPSPLDPKEFKEQLRRQTGMTPEQQREILRDELLAFNEKVITKQEARGIVTSGIPAAPVIKVDTVTTPLSHMVALEKETTQTVVVGDNPGAGGATGGTITLRVPYNGSLTSIDFVANFTPPPEE